MSSSLPLNVIIPKNARLQHFLGVLRDKNTNTELFRATANKISSILTVYATENLPLSQIEVYTPVQKTTQHTVDVNLIACPILRAGLAMLEPFLNLNPDSKVFHIGLKRDEDTHLPQVYYRNIEPNQGNNLVFVLDPMLATGGSLSYTCDQLKSAGFNNIAVISMIAAPEGIHRMYQDHPDVAITVGAIDEHLNENAFIVPGLGDAGDRYFGV